ncbi:hypothetical protein MTBBW1_1380044 [Desulfamplus magnetovallimortis]|uniref:Uncharacterized protein n=1 Tax=Desulfamplus magnetovallimortis TaxID=1246637 RepID=A0A1W1H7Q1_9BACT|nr:hypothetical protein MTBBW1_1380044 [Desulfamplus magnetovallimortis]
MQQRRLLCKEGTLSRSCGEIPDSNFFCAQVLHPDIEVKIGKLCNLF